MELNLSQQISAESQHFSGPRFQRYFRLFFAENRQRIIFSLVLIPVIYALLCIIPLPFGVYDTYSTAAYHPGDSFNEPMHIVEMIFFYVMLGLIMIVFSSMMFDSIRGRQKAFATLTLPASNVEKWLTWFLVYIIAPVVVLVASVFVFEALRVAVFSMLFPTLHISYLSPEDLFVLKSFEEPLEAFVWVFVVGAILAYQAFFALGSVVFWRLALIKTIGFFIALQIAGNILSGISAAFVIGQCTEPRPWLKNLVEYLQAGNGWWLVWVLAAITLIWVAAIYLVTFMRLREAESINRF